VLIICIGEEVVFFDWIGCLLFMDGFDVLSGGGVEQLDTELFFAVDVLNELIHIFVPHS